jgi:hypothetical protein
MITDALGASVRSKRLKINISMSLGNMEDAARRRKMLAPV